MIHELTDYIIDQTKATQIPQSVNALIITKILFLAKILRARNFIGSKLQNLDT